DPAEAARLLRRANERPVETRQHTKATPEVAFLFPGQGTQHVNMGRELYERERVFQAEVDRCAEVLRAIVGEDLREALYPTNPQAGNALDQTRLAQPALFTVGYALARLWQSWGVAPAVMLGHSVGEFVAACLAGVFALEDGLRLVARRAEL